MNSTPRWPKPRANSPSPMSDESLREEMIRLQAGLADKLFTTQETEEARRQGAEAERLS